MLIGSFSRAPLTELFYQFTDVNKRLDCISRAYLKPFFCLIYCCAWIYTCCECISLSFYEQCFVNFNNISILVFIKYFIERIFFFSFSSFDHLFQVNKRNVNERIQIGIIDKPHLFRIHRNAKGLS